MTSLTNKKLKVVDYYNMYEVGTLSKNDGIELINGEIVEMKPKSNLNVSTLDKVSNILKEILLDKIILRIQSPIKLNKNSEPKPDITLLKRRPDFYRSSPPKPEDVLLIIEVAHAAQITEMEVKSNLYASAKIPEFWIVDLSHKQIEVSLSPVDGKYKIHQVYDIDQFVFFHKMNVRIPVKRLLT